MVQSMTGFGRSVRQAEKINITVEMKTVNHRFLDLNIRLPRSLQTMEEAIGKMIGQQLKRGRVEFFLSVEGEGLIEKNLKVDWNLFSQYIGLFEEAKQYVKEQTMNHTIDVKDIFLMPEVLSIDQEDKKNDQFEANVLEVTKEALQNLYEMRCREGELIKQDLITNLLHMDNLHKQLLMLSDEMTARLREKYLKRLDEVLDGQYDEQRIYTEISILAEKADVHEELSRLQGHIRQFREEIEKQGSVGRKLDFIVQEMNREVNTIGSKANELKATKIVIELKSFIEKIREQVQNVE